MKAQAIRRPSAVRLSRRRRRSWLRFCLVLGEIRDLGLMFALMGLGLILVQHVAAFAQTL